MTVHSASAVLLVGDRYALQLRDAMAPVFAGRWSLFGGCIEPGETPYRALIREIREELSLEVLHATPLVTLLGCAMFVADVSDQWHQHVLSEGAAVRLFTPAELAAMDLNLLTGLALGHHMLGRIRELGY